MLIFFLKKMSVQSSELYVLNRAVQLNERVNVCIEKETRDVLGFDVCLWEDMERKRSFKLTRRRKEMFSS